MSTDSERHHYVSSDRDPRVHSAVVADTSLVFLGVFLGVKVYVARPKDKTDDEWATWLHTYRKRVV